MDHKHLSTDYFYEALFNIKCGKGAISSIIRFIIIITREQIFQNAEIAKHSFVDRELM